MSGTPTEPPFKATSIWGADEWIRLDHEFDEMREFLLNLHLETKDEAIGQKINSKNAKDKRWVDTAPRAFDDEVGMDVRRWFMIPYIDALDQDALKECISNGRALLKRMEAALKSRQLDYHFLRLWGDLDSILGGLRLIYFSEPNIGHARSSQEGGKGSAKRKRWFAHYLLRAYSGRGSRVNTTLRVERLVNYLIDGHIQLPKGCIGQLVRSLHEQTNDVAIQPESHASSIARLV